MKIKMLYWTSGVTHFDQVHNDDICYKYGVVRITDNLRVILQGAARLLAGLNLAPSTLRWWEKGGVGIIGKGTFRSFVSP